MRKRFYILVLLSFGLLVFFFLRREDTEESSNRSEPVTTRLPVREGEFGSGFVFVSEAQDKGRTVSGSVQDGLADVGERVAPKRDAEAIPGEHVLGFRDADDLATFIELARAKGVKIIDVLGVANAVRVWVDDPRLLDELLKESPSPVGRSSNYYVRIPEDPVQSPLLPVTSYVGFGDRALEWLGVSGGNGAWGNGVTVAVLDAGVLEHPVFENTSVERISVLDADAVVAGGDRSIHGTAVASLIAGNNAGVSGVAPAALILSVQVMDDRGEGDTFTLAKGIVAAVDRGAKVINISLGSRGDSIILKNAVDYAVANGVVIVAAAGNDALEGVSYPAAYEGVLAVSGVDAMGNHLYFSNRGPEVDIAAPGISISVAGEDGGVSDFSGTSFSSSFVSGAIAWLLSESPELTATDAVQILLDNANDAGAPGRDDKLGEGILNVMRVQERDKSGIYDIVACSPYVRKDADGNTEVTLFVENRGTEALSKVAFVASVAGQDYYVDYYNIPVGSFRSYKIVLGRDQVVSDEEGVDIEFSVTIDGVDDTKPLNNLIRGEIIRIAQ